MNHTDLSNTPEAHATPSPRAGSSTPPARNLGSQARAVAIRLLLGAAGLGLLFGFFMPWVQMGDVVVVSGFSLVTSSGQTVDILSGPHRALLFMVPLSAMALMGSAMSGHRFTAWVAILTGGLLISYGFYTLVRLFFTTTGMGMWVVALSALVALGAGLVGYGRQTSEH